MTNETLCPLCGEGYLTARTEETVTEYAGQEGKVTLHFAECSVCGSEITNDADSRTNKRAVLAFRKSVDGLLTGAEIRALRDKYGITQDQASRLFGGGPKAFSKYESDDVAHAVAMDNLLRLVAADEESFWKLVAIKGLSTEFPHRRVSPRVPMQVQAIKLVVVMSASESPSVVNFQPFPLPRPDTRIALH